ncbi:hypothetical protein ALP38_101437 [Pseudomonas amygdali pv. sesami]|nr:hypothetical protein ALP38_101437 [Pseudomonas amygdali pv. sesami]
MRSPLEQVPRRNAHQETHPRQMTGHDGKCRRVRMSFPDTPPVSGLKQVGRSPDWHVMARLRPSRSLIQWQSWSRLDAYSCGGSFVLALCRQSVRIPC